jgi:hypothetical protein
LFARQCFLCRWWLTLFPIDRQGYRVVVNHSHYLSIDILVAGLLWLYDFFVMRSFCCCCCGLSLFITVNERGNCTDYCTARPSNIIIAVPEWKLNEFYKVQVHDFRQQSVRFSKPHFVKEIAFFSTSHANPHRQISIYTINQIHLFFSRKNLKKKLK